MPRHRRPPTGLAALCGLLLAGLAAVVAGGPLEAVVRPAGPHPQVAEPRVPGVVVRQAPTRAVATAVERGLSQLHAAPLPRMADDGAPDVPGEVAASGSDLRTGAPLGATSRVVLPTGAAGGVPARGPPTA